MTDSLREQYPVSADTLALNPELIDQLIAIEENCQVFLDSSPEMPDNSQAPTIGNSRPERAKAVKGTGQNKYHAHPTEYGGRRYASKKEAAHARWLDLLKEEGVILSWVPQVPFPLPGGATHKVDFLVWYPPIEPGGMPFAGLQEVKGRDLAMGKLKRKQVEEIYRLKVEVI